MSDNVHILNTIDKLLSNDSISNASKLIELQHLCLLMPYCTDIDQVVDELPFEKFKDDKELLILLKLYQIQLHLFLGGSSIKHSRVEQALKSIQSNRLVIGKPSSADADDAGELLYLRVKYNDLLTDYQYLLTPLVDEYKFIELINKKLIILNNIPTETEDDSLDWFTQELQWKILICLLLSGTDFRKKNLLTYIIECGLEIDNEPIREYFELTISDRFIPYKKFEKFTQEITSMFPIFKKLLRSNKKQLVTNYLENNVSKLPFYYESIYLTKINDLFIDLSIEDVEDLIHQMIIKNKLPTGTSIDQINGLVIFGNAGTGTGSFNAKNSYDKLNNHIKSVGDLVNQISNSIDSE